VGFFEEAGVVVNVTERVGILDEHAGVGGVDRGGGVVTDDDLEAERFGAGLDDVDGLRVAEGGDEKLFAGGVGDGAGAEAHGFGGGGGFVEEGGVGDVETGEVADHRLEVEERFEAALGNLGLVGCVSGVPGGVFEDVALDDAGRVCAVVALADEGAEDLVLRGVGAEFGERGAFAESGGEVQRFAQTDLRGNGGVDERVEGRLVQQVEHGGDFGGVRAVVAAGEGVERRAQVARGFRGGGDGGRGNRRGRRGHKGRDRRSAAGAGNRDLGKNAGAFAGVNGRAC
jgi:hypothetical protein